MKGTAFTFIPGESRAQRRQRIQYYYPEFFVGTPGGLIEGSPQATKIPVVNRFFRREVRRTHTQPSVSYAIPTFGVITNLGWMFSSGAAPQTGTRRAHTRGTGAIYSVTVLQAVKPVAYVMPSTTRPVLRPVRARRYWRCSLPWWWGSRPPKLGDKTRKRED